MSIILAVRDGDHTWLGCDRGSYRDNYRVSNLAIKWIVRGRWALGCTGYVRTHDLLSRSADFILGSEKGEGLPEGPEDVVDRIAAELDRAPHVATPPRDNEGGPKDYGAYCLLAGPGGIWQVGGNLSLVQQSGYGAQGIAWGEALCVMDALLALGVSGKDLLDRTLAAIRGRVLYASGEPWTWLLE